MKKDELFKSDRWTKYQNVKVLKGKKTLTEEDKKKIKEFRKFIDKKIEKDAEKNV